MTIPAQTSGIGVAAQITVDSTNVALSRSGTNTHQINPGIADADGTELSTGAALVLSAAAASGAYTGTITGGGSNALVGKTFVVAGFTTAANNGEFICTASTTTVLTLDNANSASESHAATATLQDANAITYVSYNTGVATVSASGVITGVAKGGAVVEVSYPAFDNSVGDITSSGNPMNGLPIMKIYKEINVTVEA